jgi:hypothetical protein
MEADWGNGGLRLSRYSKEANMSLKICQQSERKGKNVETRLLPTLNDFLMDAMRSAVVFGLIIQKHPRGSLILD